MHVRHQIGVMSKVATAFLVPDNHLGRATVSSVAVAHEVDRMGGRSVACLNARDRNLLGLRRDLLTAAAYGVDEFLLVYGDRPTAGTRSGELTVRSMMAEVRDFSAFAEAGIRPKVAVTSRLTDLPAWKAGADLLFLQASYRSDRLAAWRDGVDYSGKVYAGVLVPPSGARARKWSAEIPEIDVPEEWIVALDRDPMAGVELACELVTEIAVLGGFDGVHLIPGVRYREVAARLEPLSARRGEGGGGGTDG